MMSLAALCMLHAEDLTKINTLTLDSAEERRYYAALKLVEEMAELSKEIVKHYIFKVDRTAEMADETADVTLMLDQFVKMQNGGEVTERVRFKCKRYIERYMTGSLKGTGPGREGSVLPVQRKTPRRSGT